MVSTLVAMSTNKGINFICYTNKEFSANYNLPFPLLGPKRTPSLICLYSFLSCFNQEGLW